MIEYRTAGDDDGEDSLYLGDDSDLRKSYHATFENADWADVLRLWKARFGDFGIKLNKITATVRLSPESTKTPGAWTWWPLTEVRRYGAELTRQQKSGVVLMSAIHQWCDRKGMHDTAKFLSKAEGDVDLVATYLIAASILSRLNRCYPEKWPKRYYSATIRNLALEALYAREHHGLWHHKSTEFLPMLNNDDDYTIHDFRALVRYLAEEHAALLLNWKPVVIV